jgi:two-component system NtrC family sensor kinase
MLNPSLHILLVEDDFAYGELVQRAFVRQSPGVRLSIASTLTEARARIATDPPALIIADGQLPDGDGTELLFQHKDASEIPVVIMTHSGNERDIVEAIQAGALDYIVKTKESSDEMPHVAERALRYWTMLADKARVENELRLRAEAEAIWRTVGNAIVSNHTLDQVLATVIQIINAKLKVQAGAILLVEKEQQRIRFAQVLHQGSEKLASMFLPLGKGIAGWVVSTGKSALVPDVTRDPRWESRFDTETGFTTRSILCVPLIAYDETIGAVELINKQVGEFTTADLELLESIAPPLAIAIHNANLQHQVRFHLANLTTLFEKVEHAKQEWELTVDAMDSGIWFVDAECRIVRANRTLANWLGTTPKELAGQFCYHAIHRLNAPPPFCPNQNKNGNAQTAIGEEIQLSARPGRILRFNTFPLHYPGSQTVGYVNLLNDVTNERALQSQLIQSEKLAAIGRLAGSMAHEINNPLQALQGCLDLALANPTNLEKQQRYLNVAKSEVERLAGLVQRLLDFYRPSKGVHAPVDVRALVEEVLTLSSKRLQYSQVTWETEWEADLPKIFGIANQLKQVFLNLVLNAIDAMPNGGKLAIRGRVIENDHRWLAVEMMDSGVGIPPEEIGKIFEPFYTTKPSGSGLGLGISHTIVNSHGGQITVNSQAGKGTTFVVWLPIQKQDAK